MTITLSGRRLALAVLACSCVALASIGVPKQEAPPDPGGVLLSSGLLVDRVDERASRARRTPLPVTPKTRQRDIGQRAAVPKQPAPIVAPKVAPAPSTSRVERVISYALAQLGEPYRWGADGPGSWDCSGLVMVAYRTVGIGLPHQSGAMLSYGIRVTRSELRRGDLVWPQAGHVGIYLGSGRFVHAPHPGDVVKVSDLYDFYAGRRLL